MLILESEIIHTFGIYVLCSQSAVDGVFAAMDRLVLVVHNSSMELSVMWKYLYHYRIKLTLFLLQPLTSNLQQNQE